MKRRVFRYLKHVTVTILIFGLAAVIFGLYHGASLHYAENSRMMDWDKDGPYIFYNDDSTLSQNYIRGNQHEGFRLEKMEYRADSGIVASSYFSLDSTKFEFTLQDAMEPPAGIYNDTCRIIAISDIESGYRTFRDFLINNRVVDKNLSWTFGAGHLVLVGDFVDRDFSTTQVLWFIYKLEQEAKLRGGRVHFILGNHELKNMQGNFESASPKYFHVAAILEKRQQDLYGADSYLGRWMASKNSIEQINGILFAHGGVHPDLSGFDVSIDKINSILRSSYYKPYYPKADKSVGQFLASTHTGISWYRGYFKDDLKQDDIERVLRKFNASAIVVGHTLQAEVNRKYRGKVVAIDVRHPKDYHKNFPEQQSQGLLIEGGRFYRVLHNGEKEEI